MQGRKEDNIKLLSLLVLLCGWWLPSAALGQLPDIPVESTPDGQVRARLETMDRQIMVGKPFRAQLEVTHPAEMVVIFPDTGGGFYPFELDKRYPEPTRVGEGIATDFVIYELWSWEIDSLQTLQLPIQYIEKGDTLSLLSNSEILEFIPTLPTDNDSLKFKRIDNLAAVGEPIAWGAWSILIGGSVILFLLLAILLYNPVNKWLKRRRIEREWKKYLERLTSVSKIKDQQDNYLLELAKVWKGYFDREWKRGLGSLSSKELEIELRNMESLTIDDKTALLALNRSADQATYGGRTLESNEIAAYFTKIRSVMEKEYRRRKEAAEV